MTLPAKEYGDVAGVFDQPSVIDSVANFYAYLPLHKYVNLATNELWPAASVDQVLGLMRDPKTGQEIKASTWLDRHKYLHQMTWCPGEPQIIENKVISDAAWNQEQGAKVYNQYRPPTLASGIASQASPWVDHVNYVYEDDAPHIINWLAFKVQHPDRKVNHALVLLGSPGIGKDTLLEPVNRAIGPWNMQEVSPAQVSGRFNGFLKSVILRISEARDLGNDNDRFRFHDHMKTLIAAPPDALRIDEKHKGEYSIPNVCGVVITSNHMTDGLYLPEDDRRHFVASSERGKDDFTAEYWNDLWGWYDQGGFEDVAAYLREMDISEFKPKAPPRKTEAFWTIVNSARSEEESEIADLIEGMESPDAFCLADLRKRAQYKDEALHVWLTDKKNYRQIPHKLNAVGYVPVRNPNAKDGKWKVDGKRQVIYAHTSLPLGRRVDAARRL